MINIFHRQTQQLAAKLAVLFCWFLAAGDIFIALQSWMQELYIRKKSVSSGSDPETKKFKRLDGKLVGWRLTHMADSLNHNHFLYL